MRRLTYSQTYNTLSIQDIENRINNYLLSVEFTLTLNEEENEVYVDFNEDITTENLIKVDLAMCTLTYFRK